MAKYIALVEHGYYAGVTTLENWENLDVREILEVDFGILFEGPDPLPSNATYAERDEQFEQIRYLAEKAVTDQVLRVLAFTYLIATKRFALALWDTFCKLFRDDKRRRK